MAAEKITLEQLQHFFRLMEKGELVTRQNFQQYLEGLSRPAEGKEEKVVTPTAQQTYPLTVDLGQTIAQMVAAGNYDWKHSDITAEHFPVAGTGKVEEIEAVLVHLNKAASTEVVLRHLDSHGLRPATIAELLAFGVKYPEIQREFPVVELGSVWVDPNGDRYVAYLSRDGSERFLHLHWYDSDWRGDCRFLAVAVSK